LLEILPGKMEHAISLYRKIGFFETHNPPTHCSIKAIENKHLFMELNLNHSLKAKL